MWPTTSRRTHNGSRSRSVSACGSRGCPRAATRPRVRGSWWRPTPVRCTATTSWSPPAPSVVRRRSPPSRRTSTRRSCSCTPASTAAPASSATAPPSSSVPPTPAPTSPTRSAPPGPTTLVGRDCGEIPVRLESRRMKVVFPVLLFMWRHLVTRRTPIGRKEMPHVRFHGGPMLRVKRSDLAERGVVRNEARVEGVRDGMPLLADGTTVDVANVVWATGFRQAFDWINLPVFGDDGYPREYRGVCDDAPGLFFCGLSFQYSFSSMLVGGAGRDAEYVARRITERTTRPAAAGASARRPERPDGGRACRDPRGPRASIVRTGGSDDGRARGPGRRRPARGGPDGVPDGPARRGGRALPARVPPVRGRRRPRRAGSRARSTSR